MDSSSPTSAYRGSPLWLPLVFSTALSGLAVLSPVRGNEILTETFLVVTTLFSVWAVVLFATARAQGRQLSFHTVLHKHHWLQACAHSSIFLYWGFYWREVYAYVPLIVAQLCFAYAFDQLLCWSRRERYQLGFGPFPIVLSTNLFLWFKNDWFYWQLGLIALGLLAKEFLRWQKDGKSAHIFNPSSFPLAVVSVGLLLAGATDHTWGVEISLSQFWPPHMYLFLFLISLPGQYFFGVTAMTMSAVVTTYLFGLGYFAATGTYLFYDSYLPIAVFLGMHLLFTDPSTSPRTELGRLVFGALYGLSTIALFIAFDHAGLPSFYDKLLAVPLLNLSVRGLDRFARRWPLEKKIAPGLTGRRRNLAAMALWATVFCGMSAVQGVGDDHPGQWLPFWQRACTDRGNGGKRACDHLLAMESTLCSAGSGWTCNELGRQTFVSTHNTEAAVHLTRLGCQDGFQPACASAHWLETGEGAPAQGPPTDADYAVLLSGSKGLKVEGTHAELEARACKAGWSEACADRQVAAPSP